MRGESLPAAALPELAMQMVLTRSVNAWLRTNYRVEEVAKFPDLFFTILNALRAATAEG